MEKLKLRDEYIKLGQALKAVGWVDSGVEAKIVIQNGHVNVNGAIEQQREEKSFTLEMWLLLEIRYLRLRNKGSKMIIESIQLENFRNYNSLKLKFDSGTNIFMEIMHRGKQISWRQYICAALQKSLQRKQG